MPITSHLFETYLKCPTKCVGSAGNGEAAFSVSVDSALPGGDFPGMRVYRPMTFFRLGKRESVNSRAAKHRPDEPARLSLGMVASRQCPLLFHLAKSLYRLGI